VKSIEPISRSVHIEGCNENGEKLNQSNDASSLLEGIYWRGLVLCLLIGHQTELTRQGVYKLWDKRVLEKG
jgi:hypothetical protein